MHAFCTYFDSGYADRGFCLWQSLSKHMPDAQLFVFCLDSKAEDAFRAINLGRAVTLILIEEVEAVYTELSSLKKSRSKVDYIFTLTPSCVRFVLDRFPHLDEVTYLDSDLLFFSSPQPLFDAMDEQGASVGIIGHRFTPALQHLSVYGLYNVGWVTFRRTPSGLACLHDWQHKCIEWCHDLLEGERFADQKYLDAWPSKFEGVLELSHPGANVALWNLEPDTVTERHGQLFVGDRPLIFYHFHGLSQYGARTFFTNANSYQVILGSTVCRRVYGPYMSKLRFAQRALRGLNVLPLIRYKHSEKDLAYEFAYPNTGAFLTSFGPFCLSKKVADRWWWRILVSTIDAIKF